MSTIYVMCQVLDTWLYVPLLYSQPIATSIFASSSHPTSIGYPDASAPCPVSVDIVQLLPWLHLFLPGLGQIRPPNAPTFPPDPSKQDTKQGHQRCPRFPGFRACKLTVTPVSHAPSPWQSLLCAFRWPFPRSQRHPAKQIQETWLAHSHPPLRTCLLRPMILILKGLELDSGNWNRISWLYLLPFHIKPANILKEFGVEHHLDKYWWYECLQHIQV